MKRFGITRGVSPRETFKQVGEMQKRSKGLASTCCGSSTTNSA